MSVKELQEYTRISKYARYNEDKKRRETWNEQVDRVMNMHKTHLIENFGQDVWDALQQDVQFAYGLYKRKRILGSQRSLQFGGLPILEKNAKLYNCTVTYIDRVRAFQECMWMLLCGCGVGFSVQKHHIAKLPKITEVDKDDKVTYQIPDSIEGWANAIGVLLSSYFVKDNTFPEFKGKYVEFDYSKIRKRGALIRSTNAKAPGPEGLRNALEKIRDLLDKYLKEAKKIPVKMTPIIAYDIIMHSSDAVISGGIRRSACIALFSKDDKEMLAAKTGSWFVENPQRGRSNNSVVLLRGETTWEEFEEIMKSVKEFGEPGFVWSDDLELLVNPCVEIGMYARTEDGKSGWQMCNLCEINGKKAKTKEEFLDACRAGAILGTIQASYTKFDYLGEFTEKIVQREALLGVSITGMMDNPDICFDPELQKKGAKLIKETNERLAKVIGINPAARTTCVKPAGTSSCVLGSSSGIHPQHAKRYFRRVQTNKQEEPIKFFKNYNPEAVEESVWSANNTDDVITFLCEVPGGAKTKNDVGAVQLLDYVKLTQSNWVTHGTNEKFCTQPWLKHNVSNTINVKENEWDDVAKKIYDDRNYYCGISLLPMDGDKDYAQAPFTTVYTPKETIDYYGTGGMLSSGLIVYALQAFDDDLWAACSCLLGIGENLFVPDDIKHSDKEVKKWKRKNNIDEKVEWIGKAQRFASNYFDGDLKKMTYCLKDVHNWKLWEDLSRTYQDVPWEQFNEEEDNTNLQDESACAGGNCEVKTF